MKSLRYILITIFILNITSLVQAQTSEPKRSKIFAALEESTISDPFANDADAAEIPESAAPSSNKEVPVNAEIISPPAVEAQPSVEIKEGVILDELSLEEMNIKDILNLISQKTGFKIVYPDNIEGNVSLYLKNIDALDALRIVLNDTNLAYDIENNTINIMRADDYEIKHSYSFDLTVKSQIVPVSYAKVLNLIDILKPIKSETGKIIYSGRRIKVIDQSTATPQEKEIIILIDKPEKVQSMVTLISKIDVPIETKTFKFVNTSVDEFAAQIKDMLTKSVGQISISQETQELSVTETPENLVKIEKLFLAQENKAKKILVEAKVIQVDLNEEHYDGIDWEAIVSDYQAISFKGLEDKPQADQHKLNLGVISQEDYNVLVEALDTVGDMEEVTTQSLITPNATECELVIPSLDVVTSQETDRRKVSMSEKKIKLYILPNRVEKNAFVLRIKPDVLTGIESEDNNLKVISEKAIVNVPDNSLVVIGGIFKENTITAKKKIPLLGDLPIVGLAFSKEGRRLQKSEVIVFLTPKMIDKTELEKPQ